MKSVQLPDAWVMDVLGLCGLRGPANVSDTCSQPPEATLRPRIHTTAEGLGWVSGSDRVKDLLMSTTYVTTKAHLDAVAI